MQRELKVNFPPIAVSKAKGKAGMAPSRKITLALIFLGDCPNFFVHTAGWFLFTGSSEKNSSHFLLFLAGWEGELWEVQGLAAAQQRRVHLLAVAALRRGVRDPHWWQWHPNLLPDPGWSHTLWVKVLLVLHISAKPARVHRQSCSLNLPAPFGSVGEIPSLSSFLLCFLCCDVKCCVQGHWVVIFER